MENGRASSDISNDLDVWRRAEATKFLERCAYETVRRRGKVRLADSRLSKRKRDSDDEDCDDDAISLQKKRIIDHLRRWKSVPILSFDGSSCVGKTTIIGAVLARTKRRREKINTRRPDVCKGALYNVLPFLSVAYAVTSRSAKLDDDDSRRNGVLADRCQLSNYAYQMVHELMDRLEAEPRTTWGRVATAYCNEAALNNQIPKTVAVMARDDQKFLIFVDSDADAVAARMQKRNEGNDSIYSHDESYHFAQYRIYTFLQQCLTKQRSLLIDVSLFDNMNELVDVVSNALATETATPTPATTNGKRFGSSSPMPASSSDEADTSIYPSCPNSQIVSEFYRTNFVHESLLFRFSKK